jgi:hypothetical protein
MKKLGIALCATLLAIMLCACSSAAMESAGAGKKGAPISARVSDYFPVHNNTRLVYQGEGNEFASYEVYTDFAKDGRQQKRIVTGGATSVRVIEVSKNQAAVVFAQGEVPWRQNMLKQESGEPEVLLRVPLEAGNAWLLGDPRTRSITAVGLKVETPLGVYNAIEVITQSPYGKTADYYAAGVGLIKTVYTPSEGEGTVTSTLAAIEEGVPLVQTIRFYYPDAAAGQLGYVDRDVSFYTNDSTREVLTKAYKQTPPEPLGAVFSPGTKINSLYLNEDGMVYIDLNRAFQKEMNAGAAVESMMLQSVANTFGHYYGVSRVLLTIDGKPYESGHISLRPGEYLTVDDADIGDAASWNAGE